MTSKSHHESTAEEQTRPAPQPVTEQPMPQASSDETLAIISLVLGLISLTGPGLILGIPAIITGSIALKKHQAGRGLSIAGLVSGIVSTVMSILFGVIIIFAFIWGLNHPESTPMEHHQNNSQLHHGGTTEHLFDSSET